eukprot:1159066-Pelagomonas_calceolata.AAC.7
MGERNLMSSKGTPKSTGSSSSWPEAYKQKWKGGDRETNLDTGPESIGLSLTWPGVVAGLGGSGQSAIGVRAFEKQGDSNAVPDTHTHKGDSNAVTHTHVLAHKQKGTLMIPRAAYLRTCEEVAFGKSVPKKLVAAALPCISSELDARRALQHNRYKMQYLKEFMTLIKKRGSALPCMRGNTARHSILTNGLATRKNSSKK